MEGIEEFCPTAYDIDECPFNLKQRLGNRFVLPKSAWNPPCHGKDCEKFMICIVSAVRELFYDTHGKIWYPDVIEKIKQYDLWEEPGYDPVHFMNQQTGANYTKISILFKSNGKPCINKKL
jgi:hypothetical protein